MTPIRPEETILQGYWLDTGSSVTADANWERIRRLTQEHLELMAIAGNGRERLYRDPGDNRLWELTPVDPNLPAGPPLLQVIDRPSAARKYALKLP